MTWRDLVHQPSHEDLVRYKLQLWQYRIMPDSHLLLKPAAVNGKSLRRAVVAHTIPGSACWSKAEERRQRDRDPDQFKDDLLTIACVVYWWDAERQKLCAETVKDLPNGLVLRYVSFFNTDAMGQYLKLPLPDSVWDYSREHPDRPGVTCSGPPCLVQDLPEWRPTPVKVKKPVSFDFDE